MNHIDENIARALGPCAEFEFDLVELSEGAVDPERAPIVQQHLAQCPRCRAYAAALQALDSDLAQALPAPALSADFDARLSARIDALRRTPDRASALAEAERDHQRLLRQLGRALDWGSVLNGVALGAVAGGALLAFDRIAPGLLLSNGLVPAGLSATTTYSLALAAAFVAFGFGFARRIAGPLVRRL